MLNNAVVTMILDQHKKKVNCLVTQHFTDMFSISIFVTYQMLIS